MLPEGTIDLTDRIHEGSDITQAYLETQNGCVYFTQNGLRFWWPKFRHAGIDPRNIKTKEELQYAVRRVAVVAFRETAEASEQDLRSKRFMSPAERASLKCLIAGPNELAAAIKAYENVIKDTTQL